MEKRISLLMAFFFFYLLPLLSSTPANAGAREASQGELARSLRQMARQIEELRNRLHEIEKKWASMINAVWMERYRPPRRMSFCGERVPLEQRAVRERLEKEFLLTAGNPGQVYLWLKRSRRFFPYIERVLEEKGLPEDLKYVAIIESDLRAEAFSHQGAGGFWQFIRSTGKRYGIRKTRYVDERLDLVASTEAATRYLKDLYRMFGTWSLALAAYNAGEKRILKEIKEQGIKDYYRMELPTETERYIFRALTAKALLSDPERYGFYLSDEDYYYPIELQRVRIRVRKGPLKIRDLAEACGLTYKELKDMNPHIRARVLPKGTYWLNLPPGRAERMKGLAVGIR